MPKSNNNLKLCHIFCRQPHKISAPSNVVSISTHNANDDGNSNIGSMSEDEDDDDYDDDLPLISLMCSEQSTKEKKRRFEYVSGSGSNACCIENENDNPHTVTTNNNKNQKKGEEMRKENAIIRSKESIYPRIAVEVSTTNTNTNTNSNKNKNANINKNITTTATATAKSNSNSSGTKSHITRRNNRLGCDNDVEVETITNNRSEVNKDRSSLSLPQHTKSENTTIKNRSRPRRFYSDSAMDFIAPSDRNKSISNNNIQQDAIQHYCSNNSDSIVNNNNNRNRNIVSKINARITGRDNLLNHRHSLHSQRSSSSPGYWPKKWKTPSWISLEQKPMMGGGFGLNSSNGNGSGNGSGSIDHMTWDAMGVLLAVATGRTISIYDWDIFRAADIQGRSDCVRNCHESEWKIPPIVQFSLPCPVASLVWNPYNMDELAVGFRVSGQMRIYNVDRVARDQSRNNRCTPPQNTYQNIALQRITGSVCDILFLDVDNVLVSVGSFLFRWKLLSSNEKRQKRGSLSTTAGGTLVWKYQPPSTVTSMAPLGSNIIVVGTNRGNLCLLDWTKRTKENSLSNGYRPTVLQNWTPHDRLEGPREDRSLRMRMGIVKLRVETSNNECVTGKRFWGRCRVMWVTQCGWLLSVILESARIRQNCLVHHSSPKVVFRNADGTLINTDDRRSWSLPYHPIGVDISSQVACWTGVPTVTKVLAHHDKFVLDSQPDTVVSKRRVLMVHTFDQEIRSIQLPKVVKDLPQSLVVHPSLEWILVGEGGKIHILVGRDLKGISSCRTSPQLS